MAEVIQGTGATARECDLGGESPPPVPGPWCICGRCQAEIELEDRICCRNHARNHENPVFEMVVLDKHALEVALINNAVWLNSPRMFTNAKICNTAYRQYVHTMVLWEVENRKRIP